MREAQSQTKPLRSKEEAEQMASAILAAHRSPDRTANAQRTPAKWKLYPICGLFTGAIVATLPSHSWVIGGLVGLAIGGVAALLGRALES